MENNLQMTPAANRLHIAIFGKRNVGKSSLINAISNQEIALVSEIAGTTTDPVYRPMELLPLGPVMLVDTAGLDDEGEIGELRIRRTRKVMDKTDMAILVVAADNLDFNQEVQWLQELKQRKIPAIGVINKIDQHKMDARQLSDKLGIDFIPVSAQEKTNINLLKEQIVKNAPEDYEEKSILGSLVKEKDVVVLVMPQDIQAPKGRLILPQVQIMRELLDKKCICVATVTGNLETTLDNLKRNPDLVITDSQVFGTVNNALAEDIPLTSFSLLMAGFKGDLALLLKGTSAIDQLKAGDNVLIAESCTHHPLDGDIGREKLPKWLEGHAGGHLNVKVVAGIDFPEDLTGYQLIVHCGGCMLNRRQMLSRQLHAENAGVPMTNFGLAIAKIHGIWPRVLPTINKQLAPRK